MSDNSYGVTLYNAKDVLPLGLVGTPWEIVFKSLRDVLKSDVDASDSGFMRKACALYFLARGDLEAVTDRDVLNGIAAALAIPYWVENFDDPTQASAVIYHWLKYKPTRANLTALAIASGMRAFKLREIYTSTEYGLSHSFGFDLGDGYATSFFAGPDAEPGLTTAQRICGALTHFFLRVKDSPTLITDITYPDAPPSGWQYFFRADQSEIRILQGYRWDLFDSEGNLAFTPDEYAVITPTVVRDKFGVNTTVTSLSEVLILDDGQLKLAWGQTPADAYCLYASVAINIPGMVPAWPSLSHTDVNIPPNMIPGYALYMTDGTQVTGSNWSIFAAYDSDLHRIDASDLYLVGTSPVRLRSRRYVRLCQVWLVPPFVAGGTVSSNSEHIIYSMAMTGLLVPGGYAYSDGGLLDMQWDFGGVVKPGGAEKTYLLANSLDSNNKPVTVTFEPDYYWWSRVIDAETKTELNDISFWANTSYPFGSAKYDHTTLKLELVGVYTDENGTIRIPNDLSMFSINPYGTNRVVGLYSANGCPTPVATYRVRVVEKTFLLANSLDSNNKPVAVTFEAGWNWWSRVVNTETKEELSNLSFWVNTAYPFGSAKYANGSQTLELVGVYTDAEGTNRVENDLSIFDLRELGSGVAGLNSVNGCATPVMTYRVKIKIPEALPTVSEITVYGNTNSNTIQCQNNITSSYTGTKDAASQIQLYTDSGYTTSFIVDNSTAYVFGYVNSQTGAWVSLPTSLSDMPNTTANPGNGETVTKMYVLLDTGKIWFVCNNSNSSYEYRNLNAGFGGSVTVKVCQGATIITVYDSSNVAYNAFKYTLNGTDYYYYVLDGTQTDWTDDLSSIGYSLVLQIDLILALRYSPPSGPFLSKTFPANDWWWSGIISQQEADSITAAGIGVITQADSSKWYCGPYGGLNYNPEFDYELLALYSDMGETPVTFNSSNFYLGANDYSNYTSYPCALFIHSINAFSTSTMTYKIRATRGGNRNNVMYLAQDRSNVTLSVNTWHPLYRRDGVAIEYSGSLPSPIGYFGSPDTYTMSSSSSGALEFRNNDGALEVRCLWPTGITGNRIVVQWI